MPKEENKKEKYKIWAIYWRDAHTQGDWNDEEGAIEFAEKSWNEPNISFGRILKENKEWLIVHASLTTNSVNRQLIGDVTMIPKALITKKILLKII